VLLRWQAPQPCRSWPDATVAGAADPTLISHEREARTSRRPEGGFPLVMPLVRPVGRKDCGRLAPHGGVVRPGRVVRFGRLIHRRGRVLGGSAVRAAFGGNLSLPWVLLRVIPHRVVDTRLGRPSLSARQNGSHEAVLPLNTLETRSGSDSALDDAARVRSNGTG
jgi:hypothetical protein